MWRSQLTHSHITSLLFFKFWEKVLFGSLKTDLFPRSNFLADVSISGICTNHWPCCFWDKFNGPLYCLRVTGIGGDKEGLFDKASQFLIWKVKSHRWLSKSGFFPVDEIGVGSGLEVAGGPWSPKGVNKRDTPLSRRPMSGGTSLLTIWSVRWTQKCWKNRPHPASFSSM